MAFAYLCNPNNSGNPSSLTFELVDILQEKLSLSSAIERLRDSKCHCQVVSPSRVSSFCSIQNFELGDT
jgi:hypothetical protein